jgi:glutathione S-transferase
MHLIGTMDSPYVRRVAVSLNYYGYEFEHRSISVFDEFAKFAKINPVVKAPTIVLDDGTVLLESSLILDYFEKRGDSICSLLPVVASERARTLRIVGLALAACDKTVQIVYERKLRPIEKQYEPWVSRVTTQLLAALRELEVEVVNQPLYSSDTSISQAGITLAVAWSFYQMMLGDIVAPNQFPGIRDFALEAEALPHFVSCPPMDNKEMEIAERRRLRLDDCLFRC